MRTEPGTGIESGQKPHTDLKGQNLGRPTKQKNAISPTREEDYNKWYLKIIEAADLAENSVVRGCMVIKPWGLGIWKRIETKLDQRFQDTGHENAYFPLFIPVSLLEKEATHVEGFAKECAVITHHRLEEVNGKLVPTGKLEEPLVVRPTSETIIGESFRMWVQSYRDLPLLINQWANVVRWEMKTRMFLRTAEFLWQEGHTVHETEDCAMKETNQMLNVYEDFARNVLAIPVIAGEKPAHERFPGAEKTLSVEAMMQDGKALQAGTSHYLGQNFAKASNIQFLSREGTKEYAHTTSWGVSTRLIGGLIMTHADDNGMRVPPKVAPQQVIILPIIQNKDNEQEVMAYCDVLQEQLKKQSYDGEPVRVRVDNKTHINAGQRRWGWIKKGAPIVIEVGMKEIENGEIPFTRRDADNLSSERVKLAFNDLSEHISQILDQIQQNYLEEAQSRLMSGTHCISSLDGFKKHIEDSKSQNKNVGFVRVPWDGNYDNQVLQELLESNALSVRCMPLDSDPDGKTCIFSGNPATCEVIIAKSY